jgi:hypothetical protein
MPNGKMSSMRTLCTIFMRTLARSAVKICFCWPSVEIITKCCIYLLRSNSFELITSGIVGRQREKLRCRSIALGQARNVCREAVKRAYTHCYKIATAIGMSRGGGPSVSSVYSKQWTIGPPLISSMLYDFLVLSSRKRCLPISPC